MKNDDMDWLADFLEESIPLWQENPEIFFREVLQFEPIGREKQQTIWHIIRKLVLNPVKVLEKQD